VLDFASGQFGFCRAKISRETQLDVTLCNCKVCKNKRRTPTRVHTTADENDFRPTKVRIYSKTAEVIRGELY